MAYFANGSEGECFNNQCALCILGEESCPIYYTQSVFNYESRKNEKVKDILDVLVKQDGTCVTFRMLEQKGCNIRRNDQ